MVLSKLAQKQVADFGYPNLIKGCHKSYFTTSQIESWKECMSSTTTCIPFPKGLLIENKIITELFQFFGGKISENDVHNTKITQDILVAMLYDRSGLVSNDTHLIDTAVYNYIDKYGMFLGDGAYFKFMPLGILLAISKIIYDETIAEKILKQLLKIDESIIERYREDVMNILCLKNSTELQLIKEFVDKIIYKLDAFDLCRFSGNGPKRELTGHRYLMDAGELYKLKSNPDAILEFIKTPYSPKYFKESVNYATLYSWLSDQELSLEELDTFQATRPYQIDTRLLWHDGRLMREYEVDKNFKQVLVYENLNIRNK
ncbi:MAG: hypothetical protein ACK4NC_01715 [Candidatus Gracilibacteria bacterium]